MKLIVVIGGIASGKSTVAKGLAEKGAALVDLDKIGHAVLREPKIKDALVAEFGKDILDEYGFINRKALAAKAFSSQEATKKLDSITHPQIIAEGLAKVDKLDAEGERACVVEISPFDGPDGEFGVFSKRADAVIAVVAPYELRVARSVNDGLNEEDAKNRMSRQVTDDDRMQWATIIIKNDGNLADLNHAIDEAWNELLI